MFLWSLSFRFFFPFLFLCYWLLLRCDWAGFHLWNLQHTHVAWGVESPFTSECWHHAWPRSISFTFAIKKLPRSSRATTDTSVLSEMVWPYGLSGPCLTNYMPRPQMIPKWPPCQPSISSTELDQVSTVSTGSTIHASTIHVRCLASFDVPSHLSLLAFSPRFFFTISL